MKEQSNSNDELGHALEVLKEHRYIPLCSDYLTDKMKEDAIIQDQLHVLMRRSRLTRGHEVDDIQGHPGRPLSLERKVARTYALGGTPFVLALYIAKELTEQFEEITYNGAKKLKRAFDLEYRQKGVEPPVGPQKWWHYSLANIDQAGWPEDWEHRWKPEIICELCGIAITEVYRKALMKGHVGIEWYPIHQKCAEGLGREGLVTDMEAVFAR